MGKLSAPPRSEKCIQQMQLQRGGKKRREARSIAAYGDVPNLKLIAGLRGNNRIEQANAWAIAISGEISRSMAVKQTASAAASRWALRCVLPVLTLLTIKMQ